MQIVDANIILRYLLKDIEELHAKAARIIENKEIHIPFEVIAEVVYVFEKIYEVPRLEIKDALSILLNYSNITTLNVDILFEALKIYEKQKIDFVDSLLVSYNHIQKDTIYSFDKKLNKLLGQQL
jgi:predicted nucleic-acid-binding protein